VNRSLGRLPVAAQIADNRKRTVRPKSTVAVFGLSDFTSFNRLWSAALGNQIFPQLLESVSEADAVAAIYQSSRFNGL